jgi:hypothetical protein
MPKIGVFASYANVHRDLSIHPWACKLGFSSKQGFDLVATGTLIWLVCIWLRTDAASCPANMQGIAWLRPLGHALYHNNITSSHHKVSCIMWYVIKQIIHRSAQHFHHCLTILAA